MKAAIYARVSTTDQHAENQLEDLRRETARRGWEAIPFIDHGISGRRDRRPALDELLALARRRQIGAVVVWRLDRLGRSLPHLLDLLQELQDLDIAFVSLNEGIDATTAAGRLQMHILGAIAQFERDRIVERVRAGIARAKKQGKRLGRPRRVPVAAPAAAWSVREAARQWGVSKSTAARWLTAGRIPVGQSSSAHA